ncbi:ribosomal L1 domain-containing protein 1 [Aulostomus maculatus]
MAEKIEIALDRCQVKKAVQALQAFVKTTFSGESLLMDDTQQISLLFTLWKIPRKPQTIRIPLPHGLRTDSEEVCLFTRDEPKMTSEQTQRFYKTLLEEKGVKCITEIIPYKVLKTEYKPYEAKRRLLGNFEMFLSDDRIRRLLPAHLGKHFYQRKKEPLCVNMQSKHLARDIQRLIQGTNLKVNGKGSCCMARVAHSGMTADEIMENIAVTVQTVVAKLRTRGPVIKVIHLKSQTSVALPIYTSDLNHLAMVHAAHKRARASEVKGAADKKQAKIKRDDTNPTDASAAGGQEEEEEIPLLVPIEMQSKKQKLEKPSKKKQLKKSPKNARVKRRMNDKSARTKKTRKTDSNVKKNVLKLK